MMEEPRCRWNESRAAVTIGALLGLSAVVSAIAGCLPSRILQHLAARIRNPEDFTPDRYRRYLQVCWFFAVSFGICAGACFRFRRPFEQCKTELWTQVRSMRTGTRSFFAGLPGVAWVSILAGIGVRVWFLNLPMAYDESYSFLNYASRPVYLSIADYNATNNHLFNTLLMHVTYRLFGQQDWALRIPVFCFGIALLPIVWGWAKDRCSEHVANVTVALVAISPALVSYSVNARGYLYLICCAVLLDWALFRIASRDQNQLAWWCVAWIASVVGAWSMPLMVYPAVGLFGWFVLDPIISRHERGEFSQRVRSLIPFGITAVVAVAAFYAPAYLFRGMLFLDRVGFDDPSFQVWIGKLPGVVAQAASVWLAVPVGIQIFASICLAIGLWSLNWERRSLVQLLAPFAVALIMICVQQVSPPPRVFLYLAPWALLICSRGAVAVIEKSDSDARQISVLSTAIVLSGMVYLVGRPYLYDEQERRDYASIPGAIARLQTELTKSETQAHRLFAPLPCDLPCIYYMEKLGFRIPVNGEPQPNEMLWMLVRPAQTPVETLSTPLIGLEAQSDDLGPWETIATFETLVLYRSTRTESFPR